MKEIIINKKVKMSKLKVDDIVVVKKVGVQAKIIKTDGKSIYGQYLIEYLDDKNDLGGYRRYCKRSELEEQKQL